MTNEDNGVAKDNEVFEPTIEESIMASGLHRQSTNMPSDDVPKDRSPMAERLSSEDVAAVMRKEFTQGQEKFLKAQDKLLKVLKDQEKLLKSQEKLLKRQENFLQGQTGDSTRKK